MKKFLKVVLMLGFLGGQASLFAISAGEAVENDYLGSDLFTPVCSTASLAAVQIYVVGGGTTGTNISCDVATDSITFTSTSGSYPGTTYWYLLGTAGQETIEDAAAYFLAVGTMTPGIPGGLFITVLDDVYGGNKSSSMTTVSDNFNVHKATNAVILMTDAVLGFDYTIAGTAYKRTFISALEAIATFSAGTTNLSVYDGDDATGTLLYQRLMTTTVNLEVPINTLASHIQSTRGGGLYIVVFNNNNNAITANKLNLRGLVK